MPRKKLKNVRLAEYIIPQHYKLLIRPDLEAFTFSGEETITVNLIKPVKEIVLHSKDIEVLDARYTAGKVKFESSKISYNTKSETVTIRFNDAIPKGKGKLYLSFRGIIAENLRGFYRSQYEHLGETKHIATTQFESTDARRAFPCFDEPIHKAVFELSLVVPKHLKVISNTIEQPTPAGIEHDPGYKVVSFSPTPKMSTYLLAYIIGEFESIETKTKDGVKIRIFTTLGKKHQAKFALDVAKRTLEFLNDYFAIPYPLPVLDLITIPDFSSGAMENWGAVTFRETALLVDENHTAFANKQHVAEVIAHELVHQWFGNLVTMEWWTYLWLNESFAPFMSYMVVDDLFPEWHFWTRFVLHDHANALQLDSLKNTHPIEIEVHHPNQISEIFDAISYDKGASILRMLYQYIGPVHFRDGLRHYLKKHSYKNTSSLHLWESFEKVSKKPVRKFMHPWLSKEGYPLVTIAEAKAGQLLVQQSRFSLQQLSDKTIWPIPMQFQLSKDKQSEVKLVESAQKVIPILKDKEYVKANPGETGFYRTMYSPALLAKLYEPIKSRELPIVDRFGIIRDLGALVKSGHLPSSAYLEFLRAYVNEDSYIIWAEICGSMSELYNAAQNHPDVQKQLSKYYSQILSNVINLVGWTPEHKESQSRALLRALVLSQGGLYGDKVIIAKAKSLFKNRAKKPIHPDMRSAVYTLVGSEADSKTFTQLQNIYKTASMQEEQRRAARGLTTIRNQKLFKMTLDLLLSKIVRSQDAPILIHLALLNTKNRKVTWAWLQKSWPTISSRYHNDHLLVFIVKALGGFADINTAKEIEVFFKRNPEPSAQRAIKQVLEQIRINAAWIKRDKQDIVNCLKAHERL